MSTGNIFPTSNRSLANAQQVSHTSVNRSAQARQLAAERGVEDQLESLVMTEGLSMSKAVEKLLPDLHRLWTCKQRIAAFRCATRKLILEEGFDPDDLIEFVRDVSEQRQRRKDDR